MAENFVIGAKVEHDTYGEGMIADVSLSSVTIYFASGGKMEFSRSNEDLQIIATPDNIEPGSNNFDIKEFEKLLVGVLDKYESFHPVVELGSKWEGGTMILKPSNPDMQPKEIPIESFFYIIVMLRDRLRVLEQNINSNAKLTDEEKVNLQQYITRVYGSLTTFNVLFDDKDNYFVGAKSK